MSGSRPTHLLSFIRHLITATANSALYSREHAQVLHLCLAAKEDLAEAMADDGEVSLLLIDEELVVDGVPLANGMYVDRFTSQLKVRGIGLVKFLRNISPQELQYLVGILSRNSEDLEIRSTDNIRFGKVEVRFTPQGESEAVPAGPRDFPGVEALSAEELASFMNLYDGVQKNRKLDVTGIAEIVEGFINAFRQVANPLVALAPLRAMDEYTFTHSTNVCILNLAQAMALGIDGQLLNDIGIAAMLHDIGKLFIPLEILNKTDKLTDAEWEIIRQHPRKGAQALLETPGVPRLAVVTAFEHHLKFNNTGYPKVPAGWQQNLCSQMTTISDIFDALRTKRVYSVAMEYEQISKIMLGMAGTELNPLLTTNFLRIIEKLVDNQ
jgi:HD-GYP domain-containing protein (c-di-GMP phosphodiesterase class II)